jgi:hypothetical protein
MIYFQACRRRSAWVLLWTLLCASFVFGQSSTLSGTVTDPQNSAIAGATISATNIATAASRTTISEKDGTYQFLQLAPGIYKVRAEATGFKAILAEDVQITVSSSVTLNISFKEIGAVSETVTVQGGESTINTSDATVGNTFNARQINQLPSEGRNIVSLLASQPGVTFIGNTDSQGQTTDYRNGSVNGGKSDQANVTLDGIDVNDQQTGVAFNSVLRVTLDSVQEFRVTTSNPNADQGRSSGGQVSLVTKSGSNDFHGALYEYHRNTVTTANDFFNKAAGRYVATDAAVIQGRAKAGDERIPRPKLIRNIFGAAIGGPVIKDRLVFFLNYEGRRDRREDNALRTVPSADMRNGILKYNNNAGGITSLDANGIKALDPAGIGINQASLNLFKQYPLPNDNTVGDALNVLGYRFKAPIKLDFNTYIARFDYNLTKEGSHVLSARGNLQNDSIDSVPQFPGQPALTTSLDNSKGIALGYTAQFSSRLNNVLRYGFTRQGLESSGVQNQPVVTFRNLSPINGTSLSNGRITPVHNITDDVTWAKGNHSLGFGTNMRFIRNRRFSLATSFSSASANASWLLGTGRDLRPANIGGGAVAFSDAMMMMLGIISQGNAQYNFDKTGKVLGQGEAVRRVFGADEYEFYGQDAWRPRTNLTITAGVRYGLYSPPWETNGNQVAPNIRLGDWFNQRGTGMVQGIPSNQAPNISYDLSGPANGKRGFYDWDKNNFAPRFAIAYSPKFDNRFLKGVFGSEGKSSIRAGFSLAYDRIGSALAVTMDQAGSFGLSTRLTNPASVQTPRTAPRFTSFNALPTSLLPAAPAVSFPSSFPGQGRAGSFAIYQSIDDTLVTPYSMSFNLSFQRELPGNMSFEVAYIGRQGRKILTNADLAMPLNLFDPASGDNYFSAVNKLIDQANTPLASVQPIPYWENLYPSIAANRAAMVGIMRDFYGVTVPANVTATQVMHALFNQVYGPDYTTALFDIDTHFGCGNIQNGDFPCSRFGPYAFWDDQFSALSAWRSVGYSNYHSMQAVFRKRFSQGFQFDFNYTLSKSFDYSSVVERNGSFSGFIVNSWAPGQRKAISDFDMRHQINSNWIYEMPFGKNKYFGKKLNSVGDAFIGGWQLGGVFRWTSGLPVSVGNGRFWPTNWNITGFATRTGALPVQETTKNAPAAAAGGTPGPNLFPDPATALKSYSFTRPGETGERNGVRGDGLFTIDFNLLKTWKLPFEGHTVQFRWEVFNATNSVRFDPLSTTLDLGSGRANFGKYSTTLTQSRVMQFALRYEF